MAYNMYQISNGSLNFVQNNVIGRLQLPKSAVICATGSGAGTGARRGKRNCLIRWPTCFALILLEKILRRE